VVILKKSGSFLYSPASIEWTKFCQPGADAMPAAQLNHFVLRLRSVLANLETAKLTEAELWERYVGQRDETAFEALVRRHGPMVLGVCRRILGNEQDAEDAFQATFLVLVRRAASLRSPPTIANWLHGVARRTALEAKRMAAKRRAKEAVAPPRIMTLDDEIDLRPALDQELGKIAEKYRIAVVLCDLEGKTRKEVARHLGWAEGTVASRLARGRSILAKRLARRGFAGALTVAAVTNGMAPACLPSGLVVSTVSAASIVGTWQAVVNGVLSGAVAELTEGVLKSMMLTKFKCLIGMLVVLGITALGAGGLISSTLATEPAAGNLALQEKGQTNPDDLQERLVELKQQLQQMEKKIAKLEQETQLRRNEGKTCDTTFLANHFKHRVPFELGYQQIDGGRIEIREVWGTRPQIEIGGQYLVRGKYMLPPGQRGKLYFYATATGDWGGITTTLDLQTANLEKQEGEFALVHGMLGTGYFHLVLADPERYSRPFANVYFGTGENVLRKKP
jgi:RNA polymerase sigma factor (sigma-70 family)